MTSKNTSQTYLLLKKYLFGATSQEADFSNVILTIPITNATSESSFGVNLRCTNMFEVHRDTKYAEQPYATSCLEGASIQTQRVLIGLLVIITLYFLCIR